MPGKASKKSVLKVSRDAAEQRPVDDTVVGVDDGPVGEVVEEKPVVEVDVESPETENFDQQILEELHALKAALTYDDDSDDVKPASALTVHELHEELGMAGSRNAFPIKEEGAKRTGQRPGMFIGIPNRHHRKHLKSRGVEQKEKLGKGAQKIDPDRPVNN